MTKKLPICPRCETDKTEVLTVSPVEGEWLVYRCPACFFAWRSTEPDTITDPRLYDSAFKFKPEDIPSFPVVPNVPPLLKQ
jgi:vanillate/4-hydroxybenzoate decarboxylase subunit D